MIIWLDNLQIARAIFDRLFKWLIIKCNNTLIDATLKVRTKGKIY